MADKDEEGFLDRMMHVWWGHLVVAAICFGLALLVYWYISGVEARGGGRVHWLVALVYNWAGLTGTVLIFAVPGAILLITGIVKFARDIGRRDED